jgi:hypothetical protein
MDYKKLYHTRTYKTFDEDQSEILAILLKAYEANPKLELQLINYYRGLPVSFKANIVSIDHGTLELAVDSQQAAAIYVEHYTFIRSKLFRHDIVAKAQYVNIRRKAVSLRQLSYVEILAERRNHIRLWLNPPIEAVYVSEKPVTNGSLVELSTAGAILAIDHANLIETEDDAKLQFVLKDPTQQAQHNIAVAAKLITVYGNTEPFHHIFSILTDKTSERHIAKFLFNRQIEIVRELKDSVV